jgi:hypothetical protein
MNAIAQRLAVFALALGLGVVSFAQQADWKAAIQTKLAAYEVTKVTPDRTEITLSGTKFKLLKGGIGLGATSAGKRYFRVDVNTYENGVVKPEFPTLIQRRAESGEARILNAGEMVWVSNIYFLNKQEGVELELVTDPYQNVRYWGTLRFVAPKGTQPDADAILASIREVLAPEESGKDAFCRALVKIASTPPYSITKTTLLPGGSPPTPPLNPNDFEYHTESFFRPGDQVTQIHAEVKQCLPGYSVEDAPAQTSTGLHSMLNSTDPPYNTRLAVVSRLDGDHTFVGVTFRRWEDPERLKMDYATIAFVSTASAICSWEFKTADQATNVNRFANYGEWYQNELGAVKQHVQDKGRLDFCSDPKEKEKFDRLMPSIWPVGIIGKP